MDQETINKLLADFMVRLTTDPKLPQYVNKRGQKGIGGQLTKFENHLRATLAAYASGDPAFVGGSHVPTTG